jgi:hypothetical protein
MNRAHSKLTYANVVATLALFIAVGGASAFAASQLKKNSVGTKQIKNSAVTAAKIKNGAITGAKVANDTLTGTQINASTLGTVPTAQTSNTAQTASSLAAPEAWHEVGTTGQPPFLNTWENVKIALGGLPEPVAFYKDQEGVVHLRGEAVNGAGSTVIFELPPGYRPANHHFIRVPVACGGVGCPNLVSSLPIVGPNVLPGEDGAIIAPVEATTVYLDGVTFRAGS